MHSKFQAINLKYDTLSNVCERQEMHILYLNSELENMHTKPIENVIKPQDVAKKGRVKRSDPVEVAELRKGIYLDCQLPI